MFMQQCLKLASLLGYQEEQKSSPGRKETQEQRAPAEAAHMVETPQYPHTTEPDTYSKKKFTYLVSMLKECYVKNVQEIKKINQEKMCENHKEYT